MPDSVTSDRGAQFSSTLWRDLNALLGVNKVNRTTSYHPQANGLVERFHRQLKDALKARGANANWSQELWAVLLAIRTTWRAGPDCSSAELVYGTTLKVPGEFVEAGNDVSAPTTSFVADLKSRMSMVRPVKAEYHGAGPTSIPASLFKASHVYVRHGAHRRPLQAPYDDPFQMLECHSKHFRLDINGKHNVVSLDRLKPVHGVTAPPITVPVTPPVTSPTMPPALPPVTFSSTHRAYAEMAAPGLQITRSGRTVRPPVPFPTAPPSIGGAAV